LADSKWNSDNSRFQCKKCGCKKSTVRAFNLARECNKCHYVESPTAGTLLHRVKFGVRKAFVIIYEMSTNVQGISASSMALRLGVSRPTAWLFMHKVRSAMASNEIDKIIGDAQVMAFAFGYKEDFRPNKSQNPKRKKMVGVAEIAKGGGIKRAYFKKIENYSFPELTKLFDSHIDSEASVVVENWSGFDPLKETYKIEKKAGVFQNFVQTNHVVHDLKTYLRSVYTSFHEHHAQRYLDEFTYRLNRSNRKALIFDSLIIRIVEHKPMSYNALKVPKACN
jgi:hypothetical protein